MTQTIWRFPLFPVGEIWLDLPSGARVVKVDVNQDGPQCWALVDPTKPIDSRQFWVSTTGSYPPAEGEYVGTFLLDGGAYVGHLWELPR